MNHLFPFQSSAQGSVTTQAKKNGFYLFIYLINVFILFYLKEGASLVGGSGPHQHPGPLCVALASQNCSEVEGQLTEHAEAPAKPTVVPPLLSVGFTLRKWAQNGSPRLPS